jgi:proline iminopeptidase
MKNNLIFLLVMSTISLSSCKSDPADEAPIQEGFIEVTGGKVWYKIIGRDKPGIPLLVLHGGPGVPHNYLIPLEALADERPVIFYDQLGCGNSSKPNDTSLWNTARFVEELKMVRSTLKLNEVHLLGQSWGTMLAVEYLLRENPAGIKSLILSAPYLSTPRWVQDQQDWIKQLPQNIQDTLQKYEKLQDYTSQAYQDAMMVFYNKHVCRMDPWPDCLLQSMEKMGVEVYNHMWGPSEFTMTGTLMHADLTPQLPQLGVRTLLTCGEYDEATPATTQFYQSLIIGSAIHVFQGASHSHHLESETDYIQVIRNFINKK